MRKTVVTPLLTHRSYIYQSFLDLYASSANMNISNTFHSSMVTPAQNWSDLKKPCCYNKTVLFSNDS